MASSSLRLVESALRFLSPCLSALIGVRQSRLLPSLPSTARSSLASPSLELCVLIGVRLSCPLLSFP
ncbi:hypothetical protein HMPREF9141_2270 [Prevotella multiformis DSM 16608]|uniref:Uncharacterized protein n=1 Tax=Prevotella multiformis DSM 16608 TaxID=888743 RepID=F0F9K3_9BACT|nr:hypothetical protein HMPREF9141_2270 [Prevotella multiformis DSM 16608]